MKKIKGMEFEDLRTELSNVIKDPKTTEEELVMLVEFFREHVYVADNELRQRAWKIFQKEKNKESKLRKK